MNCEQARDLAALAASGDVTVAEGRALASHLAGCGECRAEAQAFQALCGQLVAMREESAPDAAYAAVRARVLAEVRERRLGWAILSPAFAAVVACTVVLVVALRPEKTVVTPPAPQPAAVVADAAVHEETPQIAALPSVRKLRRAVPRAKSQEAIEPLVVHMFTDDPDVVIYWIADGRKSTADKEIIQ